MSEQTWLLDSNGIGYRHAFRWRLQPQLSLQLAPGQVAVIAGPGGSGKSTALRLLAGVLPLSAGDVKVAGLDLRRRGRKAQRLIGYLPDVAALPPDETPRQHLRIYAALGRVPWRRRRDVVGDLLELFDLKALADTPIGRLTPSAQQAVAVARALVGDPRLILLDEPLQRLDARRAADLIALVGEMAALGKGVLVATGDEAPWTAAGHPVIARLGAGGQVVALTAPAPAAAVPADAAGALATEPEEGTAVQGGAAS